MVRRSRLGVPRLRRRSRSAPPVVFVVVATLSVVTAACSPPGATEGPELLTPAPVGASPAPAADASASGATPGPGLVTPAALDREFADTEEFRSERRQLVEAFIAPVVRDRRVVEAMRKVPRHTLIPRDQLDRAYGDYPLPIGYGQTISQPSLVAQMTELLQVDPGDRVLEIGTGSGYQAAILRELTDQVYTVEIVPELAGSAAAALARLGYADINIDRRDGYFGWQEHAPFDAIVVTAAPDHLPNPLVQQLKPDGGRMVIPIGPVGDVQTLWLVTRERGETKMERVLDVRFVPFTREQP